MRNASGHQGQIVKMTGSEKKSEQEHVYNISSIKRVTRKFRVVVVQNSGKEMYKKSVLPVQSCCFFFSNLTHSCWFLPFLLSSPFL